MEEEPPLTNSPQRRRPEHIAGRESLGDVVRQPLAHVMNQQVRISMHGQALQSDGLALIRCNHRRGVACKAPDPWIFRARSEELLSACRACCKWNRLRRVQESHEDREHLPVRQNVKRVEETLIALIRRIAPENVVRFAYGLMSLWRFVCRLRKEVIRHARFHVVGFAGKNHDRLVLRLPAKPRDRSIISASVRHSNDAQVFSRCRSRRMARHDFSILYAVQNSQSKDLQGDSESRIPAPEFLFKVRVGQSLCGTSMCLSILENVRPAYHGKKLMHSAVGRSI